MAFKVFVDDNFHYQDAAPRYELGEYDSWPTAVAACQMIIDRYLADTYQAGMSAAELYARYTTFGEDPFVAPTPEGAHFSAWAYARERCAEICGAA
ncbi:MAG: hypothetical protein H6659_15680 [Ardenticatenaceae bacterium]|nr:hypothetical protein [Anaerolineales bacterium]MCB8985272.1 hypothetical protein [Ardenticatenaceae bacterium]MCB8988027.1 hypothetical protein [Ardenticatenaceae bacterium]